MRNYQKIDMAYEQLTDALDAYFNGHFHSAIVLAAAAEQLFAGYVMKHGMEPAYSQQRSMITRLANALKEASDKATTSEKTVGDMMNRVYNHSKHAGASGHEVRMDAREESRRVIDRAIHNYDQVCLAPDHSLPELALAQRFMRESILDVRAEAPDDHND